MNWDREFRHLTMELGPDVTREFKSSVRDINRLARSPDRTNVAVAGVCGILGASPPLNEYCIRYGAHLATSDVDDIQHDLLAAGQQVDMLSTLQMQWPVARLGDTRLPLALIDDAELGTLYGDWEEFPSRVNTRVRRLQASGIEFDMVDPMLGLEMFGALLTPFLGARLLGSKLYPNVAMSPNVTVTNNEDGWDVVYRPLTLYDDYQYSLGGPGSPVKGYVRPGRYKFGIVKSGERLRWYNPAWIVPSQSTIHLPLP